MCGSGSYEVVSDRGACVVWRGRLLPGLWLTREALSYSHPKPELEPALGDDEWARLERASEPILGRHF